MSTPHPVPARKSYDLYLGFGGKRFVWTNPDHGVTLTDDGIAWSAGGREWQARLRDIAAVHLGTGNIGENTIATCRLRFSDATTLAIVSSNSHGLQNDTQDGLYAEFVHDLRGSRQSRTRTSASRPASAMRATASGGSLPSSRDYSSSSPRPCSC